MNKQIEISALPDGFLIERYTSVSGHWQWVIERMSPLIRSGINNLETKVRPLAGTSQALDDWSLVPDGLAWRVAICGETPGLAFFTRISSKKLRQVYADDSDSVVYGSCIGVDKEYAQWGKAHGMEVVEL